jgi:hypothetical protein
MNFIKLVCIVKKLSCLTAKRKHVERHTAECKRYRRIYNISQLQHIKETFIRQIMSRENERHVSAAQAPELVNMVGLFSTRVLHRHCRRGTKQAIGALRKWIWKDEKARDNVNSNDAMLNVCVCIFFTPPCIWTDSSCGCGTARHRMYHEEQR